MTVTVWDLFRYINKWKIWILCAVVLAVLCAYVGVSQNQTYDSTVIIQLTDDCISKGEAPDGSDFDINEIVSPNVLKNVIDAQGLKTTVDSLRSGITIEPIIPTSELDLQESNVDLGKKYEYFPNTFVVTYSGDKGEDASEVREILEGIANSYIDFYNAKYMDFASINTIAYDKDMGNYDYIDMADMLDDNLDDIIGTLENYSNRDYDFRSMSTGYTFSDLRKEYEYLSDFIVSGIYADIFQGQITDDKTQLIKVQTQRKEEYLLNRQSRLELAEIAKSRMDNFANASQQLPEGYNTPADGYWDDLTIIEEVHNEKDITNTTTTYDILMENYVDQLISANDYQLRADRCDVIIAKFSTQLEKGVNVAKLKEEVTEAIEYTVARMAELNKTTNLVISDYNDYSATAHVKPLTGVNYYGTLSFPLYGLLAGGAVCLLAVITVLGYEIAKAVKRDDEADGKR